MSNSPPTTLGQYQIIREIARSNDIVYEAYDPLMNRRVAVKELAIPAGMTDSQRTDRVSRFKREAQAAGTLNHPNIMTVYSFAEDNGRTFMAMEFLDGHTLRNEIDTKGFLAPEAAAETAIAVLEGLSHAHAKGVIHRDIKPDNIQILSNGSVKITDFGIARLTFQPNLTMDGQVFGTPSYMSPEQVVGREIDQRSDLFSVAVVLYEMLSGQKPFSGDSVVTITYAIMNKEPQQPSQCDWALWQVLVRALDKSPQLRYNSATEMIEAIRQARKQASSGLMSGNSQPQQFNPNHPNNPGNVYTSPYANPTAGYSQVNSNQNPAAGYGPGSYGPGSAGGYNQQPYNPYQQAPTPAPPPVQPASYGYNPYAAPSPPAYPPNPYAQNQPSGYGQPQVPLPIYYPPPPRPPLFKPETVVFLKRLVVTFVVLGTLFLLVIVGMMSLATAMQRSGSTSSDVRVANQIRRLDPRMPVRERINEANKLIGTLPVNQRAASQQALAELMSQLAKEQQTMGSAPGTEDALNRALELDPTRLAERAALGRLLFDRAQTAALVERIDLYTRSAEELAKAGNVAADEGQRSQYQEQSARAYFAAAQSLYQYDASQRPAIRNLLEQAKSSAPAGSMLLDQINEWRQAILQ